MTSLLVSRLRAVLVFLLFVSSGCGGDSEKAAVEREAQEPVAIHGQVFIVTRGGDSIKLGLVSVLAYPESVIVDHFHRRDAAKTVATEDAVQAVSVARDRIRALRARAAEVDAELKQLPFATSRPQDSTLSATRTRLAFQWQDARHSADAMEATLRAALDAPSALESPAFYFEDLPQPSARVKSDADGRFELNLLAGVPIVVVARSGRELLSGPESYCWAVRIVPAIGSENSLFLSNDNLAGSGCAESVFDFIHHSGF